ncbi:MAG: hypothetical protein ACF8Q5_01455 [Phycisphaerales bacterium JB040]
MRDTIRMALLWVLVVVSGLGGLAGGGCRPSPKVVTLNDLQDEAQRAALAPEYWSYRRDVPAADQAERPAVVAFTGFEVEFITAKKELPFNNQPVIGMVPISPFGLGMELSGLGRRSVRFPPALQESVAGLLRDKLRELYEIRGSMVLGIDRVKGTAAYGDFVTAEVDSLGALQQANFMTTDTGTVRAAELRPAPGHLLITGAKGDGSVAGVERAILEELDADVSVRVHLRVGLYRGLASLERGSRVRFVTREGGRSVVESLRSILGTEQVRARKDFLPVTGDIEQIDGELYLSQLSDMMESYLSMMIWEVERARGELGPVSAPGSGGGPAGEGSGG